MIQVCCFGNSLHGDDGVGMAVYENLKLQDSAGQIHYFADVPINALSTLMNCKSAILVDAVNSPREYGKILQFSPDQLPGYEIDTNSSAHLNSISYLLAALKHSVADMPDIKICGIGINKIEQYEIGLTQPVSKAVEKLSKLIVKELGLARLVDSE